MGVLLGTNNKHTSATVASLAGKVLQDENASAIQRSLAASALRQAGTRAQTGTGMERKAAVALDNERSANITKTLAGSVVSQSNRER